MTILGAILSFVLIYLFAGMMGEFGAFIVIAVIFGMVFSTHLKIKEMHEDLQKIKKRLEIEDQEKTNEEENILDKIMPETDQNQPMENEKEARHENWADKDKG